MRPLEVAAGVVCKTDGDTASEMVYHALECPLYLLPNTMIGVLGQERLMAIEVVASGPALTLEHQRNLNDSLDRKLDVIRGALH